MKTFFHFLLCLFMIFTCSYCFNRLPSYLKLCSRSDPKIKECFLKHGTEAIPFIVKGDATYHIPSFDPFKIDKVDLEASDSIKLYGTDLSIYGLNLITINDFDWDQDNKQVTLKLFTPLIRIIGTYNMNGHILVLNLKGSGAMNNSHYDNNIDLSLKYSLFKKDGLEYAKVENFDLQFEMKGTNFYFDNILDNPTLSKHINQILNENADILVKELLPSIKLIIKNVARAIINPVAEKVTFNNIVAP